MKICLEKDICSNVNVSLRKEWLEINQFGSYACSTIYGLNYRKYHGLFVIPGNKPNDHQLMLAKFEESVFIDSQVYEISSNRFESGIHPDGHKYLQRFCIDPFPKFTYLIDGRRLEKIIFMLHDQNTLVIRYTNKNQGPPLKLIIKPILASRGVSGLTQETQKINTDSYYDDKVVKITPRPEVPELKIYYMQGEYTQAPLWYYNFQYSNQIDPGHKTDNTEKEDLFNTGFFTCQLDTYQSLDLYVSIDELTFFDYDSIFRLEKDFRKKYRSRLSGSSTVVLDISKSVERAVIKNKANYNLALPDYPIENLSTRKTILSLFGFMLVEKNINTIKDSISRFLAATKDGVLNDHIHKKDKGQATADASLLLIYFILYFYRATRDKDFLAETMFEGVKTILDKYSSETTDNIYRDKDGLLFTGTKDIELSWIPAFASVPETVRYGKLLEINALYFCALKAAEFFSRELKKNKLGKKYAEMAAETGKSLVTKFWDKTAMQFSDVIRENFRDNSFRINQLFLVALPFNAIDNGVGLNLLKQIETHLLTPFGLRSLSFKDKNYIGQLPNIINHDQPAYYQGAVWPWTVRMYVAAVLRLRGKNLQVIDYLRRVLENFDHVFNYDSIGFLPELFEGNPPHLRNGALACNLTMCEYILANYYLKRNNQD